MPTRKIKPTGRLVAAGRQALMTLIGEDNFYKARKYANINLEQRGKQVMFIHQMGKVGSTSISASLRAAGIRDEMAIYQTHFLSDAGMAFLRDVAIAARGGWDSLPPKGKKTYLRSPMLLEKVHEARDGDGRVKVITLVRDPVATNVSGFFHNFEWWPDELTAAARRDDPDILDRLLAHFLANYPHRMPLQWFDMEIKAVFDVDVYAEPFDRELGYRIYHGGYTDMVLIKLERLNDRAEEVFKQFLSLDHFELVSTNLGEEKWYSPLYDRFKKWVALPDSYLDELYQSEYATHFYTPDEIAAFRRRWAAT